jgi:hypothetical protein
MKTLTQPELLLDDGNYYIVLNPHQAASTAAGFLQRRCSVGSATPGGFECVGSFAIETDGRWAAHIAKDCGAVDDSSSTAVTTGVDRLEAIIALWQARRLAPPRLAEKACVRGDEHERFPVTAPARQGLREESKRRPERSGPTPAKEGSIAAAFACTGFAASANAVEIWPMWLLAL